MAGRPPLLVAAAPACCASRRSKPCGELFSLSALHCQIPHAPKKRQTSHPSPHRHDQQQQAGWGACPTYVQKRHAVT
eukprot:3572686-Amphidinium_carterae.1